MLFYNLPKHTIYLIPFLLLPLRMKNAGIKTCFGWLIFHQTSLGSCWVASNPLQSTSNRTTKSRVWELWARLFFSTSNRTSSLCVWETLSYQPAHSGDNSRDDLNRETNRSRCQCHWHSGWYGTQGKASASYPVHAGWHSGWYGNWYPGKVSPSSRLQQSLRG